jgi:SH3-like domain-containing protein
MRRIATGLAALSLPLAVFASPASAAPTTTGQNAPEVSPLACTQPSWTSHPQAGGFTTDGTNIRIGPTTQCTSVGLGYRSHSVTYHCYRSGEGGTWTHLRNNTTGAQGWVKDSLLVGYGSSYPC